VCVYVCVYASVRSCVLCVCVNSFTKVLGSIDIRLNLAQVGVNTKPEVTAIQHYITQ